MKNSIKYLFILGLAAMSGVSCNKELTIVSTHQASDETQWSSYEDARGGIAGMYGLLRAALMQNTSHFIYGDVRGGDFTITSRTDLNAIKNNKLTAAYTLVSDLSDWQPYYAVVNSANLFIERAEGCLTDQRYTEQNYKVDIAAAHLVRDFVYFLLVRNWGDIPFMTSSHDGEFTQLPRTSAEKVLSYLKEDILANVNELPFSYGSGSRAASYVDVLPGNYYGYTNYQLQNTVFGRVQAYLVLAHIAAWEGNYDEVEEYTRYVRDNFGKTGGSYFGSLSSAYITDVSTMVATGYNGLFSDRGNWKPTISITGLPGLNETGLSGEGHLESLTIAYPLGTKPKPDMYVNKDSINKIYSNSLDTRYGIDTTTDKYRETYFTNINSNLPIFKKVYVVGNGYSGAVVGDPTGFYFSSNIVWSRAEEIMSLRAIALAYLQGNNSTEGRTLLNTLRANRGLPAYSSSADIDLIDELYAERRRELIGEGWRWYDLVEYKKIKGNDPDFNKLVEDGGIYWPVSKSALAQNPLLVQTPHWSTN